VSAGDGAGFVSNFADVWRRIPAPERDIVEWQFRTHQARIELRRAWPEWSEGFSAMAIADAIEPRIRSVCLYAPFID
jgi:hypothetical protein